MLILKTSRNRPLPIESFMLVVINSTMAFTLATSEGLEQVARSQVNVSVTTYSTCQFWVCKLRDDDSSRRLLAPLPHTVVISATQLLTLGQANPTMVLKVASVNAASSAWERAHMSLLVEMLPGVRTVCSTMEGWLLGMRLGDVVGDSVGLDVGEGYSARMQFFFRFVVCQKYKHYYIEHTHCWLVRRTLRCEFKTTKMGKMIHGLSTEIMKNEVEVQNYLEEQNSFP